MYGLLTIKVVSGFKIVTVSMVLQPTYTTGNRLVSKHYITNEPVLVNTS